jgi:hypothetical protein
MGNIGRYCKAYHVEQFREFDGWAENVQNARKEKQQVDGKEVEVARSLEGDDILYLQEDYTVTDGIFTDEHVIFNNVTPEWEQFCEQTLHFEVPVADLDEAGDAAEGAVILAESNGSSPGAHVEV